MSTKPKSAQAIAMSSVATKVSEETKGHLNAKAPEGIKPTIVSARITKSIMAKAIEAKQKESPRDAEHGLLTTVTTEGSAIADASLAPCDMLTVTDKLPVPADASVFAGLVMITGMSMLADASAATTVLSATTTADPSLANHMSSKKVGKLNIGF